MFSAYTQLYKEHSSYSLYFKDKIFLCNGNELDCSFITVSTNYKMINDEVAQWSWISDTYIRVIS